MQSKENGGVAIHPLAAAEIRASVRYYERLTPGMGRRLNRKVVAIAHFIARFPLVAQSWKQDPFVRIVKVGRYPYRLPYQLRRSSPLPPPRILALAHTSRRPGYWEKRIDRG